MEYRISLCNDIFEINIYGDSAVDGYIEFIDELLSHEKWYPGSPILVNVSQTNAGPLTVDNIKSIASYCISMRSRLGNAKVAHLVSRDLEFGLVRMWQTFIDGEWDTQVQVFRSREEAVKWLKSA